MIYVEGRVQGVGFRWFCQTCAIEHHLTGTVCNLSNGMVEVFAQGEEKNLDLFISDLRRGSQFSSVEDVYYKECELKENEKSFKVVY